MKTFKRVHLISAIVAMSALTFVACGDDDSASTYNIIESSDTDEIDDQGEDAKSSSSVKKDSGKVSSSSVKEEASSSSKAKSSSSSEKAASSSSKKEETAESSSSSEKAEPSSSAKEESAKSSSSSEKAAVSSSSKDKSSSSSAKEESAKSSSSSETVAEESSSSVESSSSEEQNAETLYTFGYALKNAPRPSAGCGKNSSLVKTKTIENGERYEMMVEGLNREYFITLPKDYDKTKPYKLLFAMHSMGSNAEDFVHHYADQDHPSPYYGQQDLDKEGNYIFVSPRGDTDTWPWRMSDDKDHQFFDKLLTTMENNYCIDTSRVFVTGFAFGALFTYSLAEEFQDRIRAIVTYAVADYNIYEPHENGMEKSLPIAWMNVHGKNDPMMLYEKAVESALPRILKKNGKASDGDSQFTDASGETPAEVAEGESGHVCYDFTKVDERFPVKWCTWNGRSQWTAYDYGNWQNTWVPEEVHKFLEQF